VDIPPRKKTEEWARVNMFVEFGEHMRDGRTPDVGLRKELKGMFGMLIGVGTIITLLGVLLLMRGE
jgi:hypothetical protein